MAQQHSDRTALTELDAFFAPVRQHKAAGPQRVVPMLPGETVEEAIDRQQKRAKRIQQQISARNGAAS